MTYLRNRLPEWSTWVGLAVVVAALVLLWIYRDQVIGAAVVAGSALAAIPQRRALNLIRAVLARDKPAAVSPPAQPSPTHTEQSPMAEPTLIETLETQVANFALSQAASLMGASGLAPQAQKVFTDILAARSAPSVMTIVAAGIDAATLIHDLLAKVQTLEAAQAAQQPAAA